MRDLFREAKTLLKIRARKFARLLQHNMSKTMLDQIVDGRTDLVFDYVSAGHAANSTDKGGVPLIKWCAYYGDVSAIKFLVSKGESLKSLGDNFDLIETAFFGHWRLCQFLIEQGADVNKPVLIPAKRPSTQPSARRTVLLMIW